MLAKACISLAAALKVLKDPAWNPDRILFWIRLRAEGKTVSSLHASVLVLRLNPETPTSLDYGIYPKSYQGSYENLGYISQFPHGTLLHPFKDPVKEPLINRLFLIN